LVYLDLLLRYCAFVWFFFHSIWLKTFSSLYRIASHLQSPWLYMYPLS